MRYVHQVPFRFPDARHRHGAVRLRLLRRHYHLLPGLDPVFIKMGLEFIMNFFNYAVSRFFVFDDRKAEHGHEA